MYGHYCHILYGRHYHIGVVGETMKITTNIDERLLSKAMRAMRAGSQREVLEAGLRNLLADIQRKTFVKEFSRYRLNWTAAKLLRSRV